MSYIAEEDANIYVSMYGDDTFPGTLSAPVRSMERAIQLMPTAWKKKCQIHFIDGILNTMDTEESDTEIEVGSTDHFTDSGVVSIDNELITYSGINAGRLTECSRDIATWHTTFTPVHNVEFIHIDFLVDDPSLKSNEPLPLPG